MKTACSAARAQRGISLIEIMVALAVGLLLTAEAIQILANNKQTYRVREASARIQESGRVAMESLTLDLRMAGYMGCAGASRTLVNTLNASSFLYDFDTAIEGFEATSGVAWTPSVDASIASPLGGRDILTIRGVFEDGVAVTGQPKPSDGCKKSGSHSADLKIASVAGLAKGDIVIAGNCARASIFQITATPDGNNIQHNTGNAVTPGNATKDLRSCYAGNGELNRITTRSFYIRDNPSGLPALYRRDGSAAPVELVAGVENMQVLYGRDADGDTSADQLIRANDVSDWDEIVNVHVSLLVQSLEDNLTAAPQAYVFNGATVTPNDRRLRRVFSSTIGVRNKLP